MCLPLAAALTLVCFAPLAAGCQTATDAVGLGIMSMQQNDPVTVVLERKTLQTLADGTHIEHTTHMTMYRDSEGRSRNETEILGTSPATMLDGPSVNVSVFDVVAGARTNWVTGERGNHQYTVLRAPTRLAPPPVPPMPAPNPNAPVMRPAPQFETSSGGVTTQREDLGMQSILGATCGARRTTVTYPTHSIGNDRPIVTVAEWCYSTEFQMMLSDTRTDPRSGMSSLRVVTLTRGEPSPALFQPPPGYTDQSQPRQTIKSTP